MLFSDRRDAGRQLAERLRYLIGTDLVVAGLPRGGVPVARAVADRLEAPLDVILVRKLGVPSRPELAMGAIGEGGIKVLRGDVIGGLCVPETAVAEVERREQVELDRQVRRYRAGGSPLAFEGRVVVVVDDGLATGSTAAAACQVARRRGAARVVLAVPVAAPGWSDRIGTSADEHVALACPAPMTAIGRFYADFSPTGDDEVLACLESA